LFEINLVSHRFPDVPYTAYAAKSCEAVTYLLLFKGGFSKSRALLLAFQADALTPPLGALAPCPVVECIGARTLGAALALSSGVLIYFGATHLLPRAEREPRRFSLIAAVIVASKG
jgi:zinc transporter ZupT